MNLTELLHTRHATKAFDPARTIRESDWQQLLTLLRYAPSSVNSQPWHYIVARTSEGKERMARSMIPPYVYNGDKVRNASHVVVLCAKQTLDDAALQAVLDQEIADSRFPSPGDAAKQHASRQSYANLHRLTRNDLPHWTEKQTYIALGMLLLGAASLGIDACPMEGFDPGTLSNELHLAQQGLAPVTLVALGYRSAADWNAALPKSRLPVSQLFTFL